MAAVLKNCVVSAVERRVFIISEAAGCRTRGPSTRQFVRPPDSVPISTRPILFTPLFAVTMWPWAVASK